jgi:hypothetical protein
MENETTPAVYEAPPDIVAVEINETCKEVLRWIFQNECSLEVSHPSSVVPLTVALTTNGVAVTIAAMVDGRIRDDTAGVVRPACLDQNAFFAVHDLLDKGLVEISDGYSVPWIESNL